MYSAHVFCTFFVNVSLQEKRDLITGLKTRTNAGRPNWSKVRVVIVH